MKSKRAFITNFNTLDLQAVPGSGKTTALLAKLLILEKKLPFEKGSGILVLSHTNAAIDEIKDKIAKHCPRLFSYPNFVGTIQSFVDGFLAVPFYLQLFKKKPVRIDNEIYEEFAKRKYGAMPNSAAKSWLIRQYDPESIFLKMRYDTDFNLLKKMNGDILLRASGQSDTYKQLCRYKNELMHSGLLCFDDAYNLAELYCKGYPEIINILQRRFKYVFVDEMQDMDVHQNNILEKLFYADGSSLSYMQRIGDKNQSIYNSVHSEGIWVDRPVLLKLEGSQRLSPAIARVVENFALYKNQNYSITGLNIADLLPRILLYDDQSVASVIPFFSTLVADLHAQNRLPDYDKYPVKVVAWNTEWKDESRDDINKLRLCDFHTSFSKDAKVVKIDYNCLKSYLIHYDKQKCSLEPVRKSILNALVKVLRLEGIHDADGRAFTKKKLIDTLKNRSPEVYERFSHNLFNWSLGIINHNVQTTLAEIRVYLPELLSNFSPSAINSSHAFIYTDEVSTAANTAPTDGNIFLQNGLPIEITSVHSVKGHSHCATLYIESYYSRGYGSYESERLRNQFLSTQSLTETLASVANSHDKIKQSAKMAFVGFSRPTNLLCVAIHKMRFNQMLTGINTDHWEIHQVQ
jgi:DNA helicase-2/ATP-dependent DNA helicase PcrA